MFLVVAFLIIQPVLPCCYASSPFNSKSNTSIETKLPKQSWIESILRQINRKQLELRNELSGVTRQYKKEKHLTALFVLVIFSFLYGLLHALGPGHGKSIVMSYMLADENPSILKGATIGSIIAFGESLFALIIVYGVYFGSIGRIKPVFDASAEKIQQAAYLMLIVVGLVLLVYRSKKRLPLLGYKKRNHEKAVHESNGKGSILVAVSLGMIPCPGVMVLLMFMLAMKLPLLGVFLALIMACGMAITISAFGIVVVLTKSRVVRSFAKHHRFMEALEAFLEISGALLIVAVAATLFLSM